MIRDISELVTSEVVRCDVCIVGAGAAGVTLALELAKAAGLRVLLLEAGGETYDRTQQVMNKGHVVGRPYYDLEFDRVRQLGGSTNHWGGWCAPMTEEDFASSWPINWSDIEQHYKGAAKYVQIKNADFAVDRWMSNSRLLTVDPARFTHHIFQFSPPTKFGEVYRGALQVSKNIEVILHAAVTRIDLDDGGRSVVGLEASSIDGRRIRVAASKYVLAAGGIENPRLLLVNRHQEANGIGNRAGLVGRFFMDHLEGTVARIHSIGSSSRSWMKPYEKRIVDGIRVKPAISLNSAVRRSRRVRHVSFRFDPVLDLKSGYSSAKSLVQALTGKMPRSGIPEHLYNSLKDLDEIALWMYHRVNGTNYDMPASPEPARVMVSAEPTPYAQSRVLLSNEKDAFGLPRVVLDWRLSAEDKHTVLESSKLLVAEVTRLTGNRLQLDESLLDGSPEIGPVLFAGHHHMGTTRMGPTPVSGVVDTDCKVHGIENLYIAGSSIFPSVGYANPTLTIVAFALRLSSHLLVSQG